MVCDAQGGKSVISKKKYRRTYFSSEYKEYLDTTELSFLVILQILARAGLVGVYKKCSLVKMNHQYVLEVWSRRYAYERTLIQGLFFISLQNDVIVIVSRNF